MPDTLKAYFSGYFTAIALMIVGLAIAMWFFDRSPSLEERIERLESFVEQKMPEELKLQVEVVK